MCRLNSQSPETIRTALPIRSTIEIEVHGHARKVCQCNPYAGTEVQRVDARAADQQVIAQAAKNRIITGITVNFIVACFAKRRVIDLFRDNKIGVFIAYYGIYEPCHDDVFNARPRDHANLPGTRRQI